MIVYSYSNKSCSPAGSAEGMASSYEANDSMPLIDLSAFRAGTFPHAEGAEFVMARLEEHPDVIAVDASLAVAHGLFGRMSAFVEIHCKSEVPPKDEAPRGAGYDLRIEDIADYFSACRRDGVALGDSEGAFLAGLLEAGLLARSGDGFVPLEDAAVIAVGNDLPEVERKATALHEYAHALYFLDAGYRARVDERWDSLDTATRRFLSGAMRATPYYGCGADWLIATETDAFSRSEVSSGALLGLLISAEESCPSSDRSEACMDFWAFEGNLGPHIESLHAHFSQEPLPGLSEERPIEAGGAADIAEASLKRLLNIGTLLGLDSDLRREHELSKLSENLRKFAGDRVFVQRPSVEGELTRLQYRFDLKRGRTACMQPESDHDASGDICGSK